MNEFKIRACKFIGFCLKMMFLLVLIPCASYAKLCSRYIYILYHMYNVLVSVYFTMERMYFAIYKLCC